MEHPNPNPNPNYTPEVSDFDIPEFQLSDYLMLEDGSEEDFSTQTLVSSEYISGSSNELSCPAPSDSNTINEAEVKRNDKEDCGNRVAFITKSELETMDDGFSWRKYGKKRVKSSPYPRNYYKCSSGGCKVKKRVERDSQDSRYVITTYDGTHNHESASAVSYHTPLMIPDSWTLQPSSSSHSSS